MITILESGRDSKPRQPAIPNKLYGGLRGITSLGFNQENDRLVIGSEERIGHWNLKTEETRIVDVDVSQLTQQRYRGKLIHMPVQVSPDGKYAAVWQRQSLAIIDPQTGRQRHLIPTGVFLGQVSFFLKDGKLAVTFRDSPKHGVKVFDLNDGVEVASHVHGFFQRSVAFANQAGVILTCGKRGHDSVQNQTP